jgi:hypothetical protein
VGEGGRKGSIVEKDHRDGKHREGMMMRRRRGAWRRERTSIHFVVDSFSCSWNGESAHGSGVKTVRRVGRLGAAMISAAEGGATTGVAAAAAGRGVTDAAVAG